MDGQKVASRLLASMRDQRAFEGRGYQAKMAKEFGVSPAALSKEIAALERGCPPDDTWLLRFAGKAQIQGAELEDLWLDAHIERSRSTPLHNVLLSIKRRTVRVAETLMEPSGPELLRQYLHEVGIDFELSQIRKVFGSSDRQDLLSSLSVRRFAHAYQKIGQLAKQLGGGKQIPSAGQIMDQLLLRAERRYIRPKDRAPAAHSVPIIDPHDGTMWTFPIVRGLLGYLIELKKEARSKAHSHGGIEAALFLKGRGRVHFRDGQVFDMDVKDHGILVYDSKREHWVEAKSSVEILVVHFDPKFVQHWPMVLSKLESSKEPTGSDTDARSTQMNPENGSVTERR